MKIDRVNAIHGDAFRQADGDREVALSILAQRIEHLETALRRAREFQPHRVEWFRVNGIVFDRAPNGDVTDWQNIAFHIYTDLCEVEAIARAALGETAP
jgi:hypothetical protein